MASISTDASAGGREHITLANQLRSPFLRLPEGIRNKIYHHLFYNTPVEIVPSWDLLYASYAHNKEPRSTIALMYTCRQIYNEAYGLFISLTTFELFWLDILGFVEVLGPVREGSVSYITLKFNEDRDRMELGKDEGHPTLRRLGEVLRTNLTGRVTVI